jgi:Cys-tRNA(Pro)/Cys-tRNA(Cys) deacylase
MRRSYPSPSRKSPCRSIRRRPSRGSRSDCRTGAYAIVALRGDARADYKKIAAALGVRRDALKMATAEDLARDLDMEPGGVAPLPVLGAAVLFDQQTLDLETIFCGAGRAGATLEIQRAELVRIAGGATADLTKS